MPRFPYDDAVLRRAMKVAEVSSKAALARRFGITPQTLNTYRAEGRLPLEHLVAFALNTGTSVDWLLRGEAGGQGSPRRPALVVAEQDPHWELLKALRAAMARDRQPSSSI